MKQNYFALLISLSLMACAGHDYEPVTNASETENYKVTAEEASNLALDFANLSYHDETTHHTIITSPNFFHCLQ